MSWLFSQALVEEYLGDICSDGEPSAQSNGNHTQQAYCAPDKMTDFSRLSRFGMMFKPLTESRGEELLMLFRADFPVKTYPLQGGGKGIEGERSGMWREMARIIGEVRPQYAFIENSPMLTTRGLERVLADLAKMGFDARWGVLGANDVGAPHKRERIWILAYPQHGGHCNSVKRVDDKEIGIQKKTRKKWGGRGLPVRAGGMERDGKSDRLYDGRETFSNTNNKGLQGRKNSRGNEENWAQSNDKQSAGCSRKSGRGWEIEPDVGRVANGVAARMDRIKALGNGQVSQVAAFAWEILSQHE